MTDEGRQGPVDMDALGALVRAEMAKASAPARPKAPRWVVTVLIVFATIGFLATCAGLWFLIVQAAGGFLRIVLMAAGAA